MRIGIDARPLISKSPSGIGNYLINILRHCSNSSETEFILYSNDELNYHRDIVDRFEVRVIPGKVGTLWVCFQIGKQLRKDQIDVFWGTQHMIPLNTKGIRLILTVHDLALLVNPRWGSTQNSIMQNVFGRLSCKKADKILADSNATAADIVKLIKREQSDIRVIALGGGTLYDKKEDRFGVIYKKYQLRQDSYFLYMGTIEPRKNIINIVNAYDEYCSKYNDGMKLVISGGKGWKYEPIFERINQSKYRDRIIVTGYVSEEEKTLLLSNAKVFVFPSNYEGFGLPILEAMSYGLPVVTSSNSSLPEVGGDLAYYVKDPENFHEICEQLRKCVQLSEDDRLALSKKEIEWYLTFDWSTCAYSTINELIS